MAKRGLTEIQLNVLHSLAINGGQNIQEIQLREGMNYATTNRSVKMLERLSFIWMSNRDEKRGPKGAQTFSLTPLGVVEAFIRGDIRYMVDRIVNHWSDVAPRYVHHWKDFRRMGFAIESLECLWKLYPERVVINRIIPLHRHETFISYIQPPHFHIIRDGFDYELLDEVIESLGVSKKRTSFMNIVSSDLEYLRVWNYWFWMQNNRFKRISALNTGIKKRFKKMQ